jgi:hypothetical protein
LKKTIFLFPFSEYRPPCFGVNKCWVNGVAFWRRGLPFDKRRIIVNSHSIMRVWYRRCGAV